VDKNTIKRYDKDYKHGPTIHFPNDHWCLDFFAGLPSAQTRGVDLNEGILSGDKRREKCDTKGNRGKNRMVFVLRDVEGFNTDETAQILNVSPASVKVRLHRARLFLREKIKEYFTDDP